MPSGLVVVVDYGLCNVDSIARGLQEIGARVEVARMPEAVRRADRIILPGVGAFGTAMKNLTDWGLAEAIRERLENSDTPFLGICLGMQLMALTSEEHGTHRGLDLVKGRVLRMAPSHSGERIPHMGWNEVEPVGQAGLFNGIKPGSDFYFVHSYHVVLDDPACCIARTPYCGGITSALQLPGRPIFGTQFHPEKSQQNGQLLLRNFLSV